jgi:hypothetical protein
MSLDLHLTTQTVSDHMDRILQCFKPGAKITVIVRSPEIPGDTDFILTNDDLEHVVMAIWRQQKNHSKPTSPT